MISFPLGKEWKLDFSYEAIPMRGNVHKYALEGIWHYKGSDIVEMQVELLNLLLRSGLMPE